MDGIGFFDILCAAFCGCIEEKPPKYAKPSETVQETTTVSEQQLELLKTVTHAEVWVYGRNWDEDAENDGIALYIRLLDEKDEIVKFRDVNLPVEIEMYTLKYDNGKPIREGLMYKGNATMTSWKDGSLGGSGIRIPFEDINFADVTKAKEGIRYEVFVKVQLPDGRVVEAKKTGNTKWWFYG